MSLHRFNDLFLKYGENLYWLQTGITVLQYEVW